MTELPDDVRALLAGPNYAHLATLMPDGAPHSVPLWVGLEGDRVAFLTDPTSRKARNLERDPRVAISLTDREQPFTMAAIRGRVAERLGGRGGLRGDRPHLPQVHRPALPAARGTGSSTWSRWSGRWRSKFG